MSNNSNNKKKILIIDNDKAITNMLRMLMETRGYEVKVSDSGKNALETITTHTDLILLDIVLNDQDGFEICSQIKKREDIGHIPVIILSSKFLSSDIIQALYLGADDYVKKPFEFEELVARMEAVMRRGRLVKGEVEDENGVENIVLELRKIIDEGRVVPFFQPIFKLHPFGLLGFEALCRPKTDTMLINPEVLFKAALQYGCYQDLEILSWKKAIEYAAEYLNDNEKLFLNCNPYLVEGLKFLTIKNIFEEHNVSADSVVLEITERSAIKDPKLFYEHLKRYKEGGFKFAVDDVGGGYASIESIVETKPEIVKVDQHIIRDIDKDDIKVSIVKFIIAFCKENGILSIAEGIERKEELDLVMGLGIDAVQGYYLARPNANIDIDKINKEIAAFK